MWTAADNKVFETALAIYDENTPNRWEKVTAMLTGKTVCEIIARYAELEADIINIEAGLVPFTSPSTTDCNLSETGQVGTQKKKRRCPWTIHEHKLLLFGLKKHGIGDWKGIARNVVTSRTPAQVASHAQKYFNRKNYNGNVKRRASIHDITELSPEEEAFIESDLILDSLLS